VVTSHGPRGVQDATPYNHFSLLQTTQRSFGLGCLESTCDTTNVTPLAPGSGDNILGDTTEQHRKIRDRGLAGPCMRPAPTSTRRMRSIPAAARFSRSGPGSTI
jgi:hypothetical protein